MIKEKEILIIGHPRNIKYYEKLGYLIKVGQDLYIKTQDLMKGSSVMIISICDNCGKETKNTFKDYWNYTKGFTEPYYCNSCKKIKSEKTNLEKWGVKNPMQNEGVKKTLKKSLLEKYGVDSYSKTDGYKEKFTKTSMKNWGFDNPSKSQFIIDKIKKTNNDRIGVDWPMQLPKIIKKSRKSFISKWGNNWISKTEYFRLKLKETSQLKWGVDNYSQTQQCKDKTFKTNNDKWGGHPSRNEYFKAESKNTKERNTYKKYANLIGEKYEFISYTNEIFELIHKECGTKILINKGLLLSRYKLNKMICTECNPIGVHYSNFELEVALFIKEMNIDLIRNDKMILNGMELDIFIPLHNIAIECNGIYWHSELFKNTKYHLNKTLKCKELGIELLHIWEDDWVNKKEIIKSIIKYKVNIIQEKIFARKCVIKKVTTNEYKEFLNNNHIQGYSSSSYNIGLYYKEKLVSLMTFGYRRTNNKKEYELIRFCNKKDIIVIGAASKLFNYFKKNIEIDYVVSYADISIFKGDLYSMLGFKKAGLSDPNYFWVIDGIKKHRYNYSKSKLINAGFDKNKTEVEIMHERGYYRIFSTGQEKWIWKRND